MKGKHLVSFGLALAMVLAVVAQSNAMMRGRNHGSMMGETGMGYYGQTLSTAQQAAVDKIEKKYQAELIARETAVQEKTAELRTADNKDNTTLGELNKLRAELGTLEGNYWALRDKINVERSQAAGGKYYGNMGRDLEYCAWHDDQSGMQNMNQMYSQRGPMLDNGPGWCRL